MPCLVIFIGYMIGMMCISGYAFHKGDPRRLTHGFDYKGDLCGVDMAVADRPLLYWCAAGSRLTDSGHPEQLDTKYPICVERCPMGSSEWMPCLGESSVQVTPSGSEPFVSQRITITQNTVKQASYRTREFAGMFCVPHFDEDQEILGDDPLVESLLDDYGPIGNSYYRMAAAFGGLRRSWRMVLGAVVFSVFLSYLYLLLLRIAPYPTAIVSLALVMLATLFLSIYFLLGEVLSGDWKVSYQNNNSFYKLFATSYAAWVSRIVGILLLGMFFFMVCGLAAMQRAIYTAVGCVNMAVGCIFGMPSMMLTPCVEAIVKLALWFQLFSGLTWLLATAEMEPTSLESRGDVVAGMTRKLVFSHEQTAMLVYYVVGTIWLVELSKSLTTFVVSYAVILWYYQPKPKGLGPSFPLMRGLIVCFFFHLGTIALGSFMTAVTRPFRITFTWLSRQSKEGGNPCISLLATLCTACISFTQRHLAFLTKDAYIDVVISSTPFLTAAQNAFGFIKADTGKVSSLSGSVWIISFAVTSGVFTLSVAMLWTLLVLNDQQMKDSHYRVENPYFVATLSGLLSASLAGSFMVIFEHCSDTLLYVFHWNKSHGHNTVAKYCPDELMQLMEYKKVAGNGKSARPEQAGIFSGLGGFFSSDAPNSKQGQSPEAGCIGP
eukprot:s212_g19.t1